MWQLPVYEQRYMFIGHERDVQLPVSPSIYWHSLSLPSWRYVDSQFAELWLLSNTTCKSEWKKMARHRNRPISVYKLKIIQLKKKTICSCCSGSEKWGIATHRSQGTPFFIPSWRKTIFVLNQDNWKWIILNVTRPFIIELRNTKRRQETTN